MLSVGPSAGDHGEEGLDQRNKQPLTHSTSDTSPNGGARSAFAGKGGVAATAPHCTHSANFLTANSDTTANSGAGTYKIAEPHEDKIAANSFAVTLHLARFSCDECGEAVDVGKGDTDSEPEGIKGVELWGGGLGLPEESLEEGEEGEDGLAIHGDDEGSWKANCLTINTEIAPDIDRAFVPCVHISMPKPSTASSSSSSPGCNNRTAFLYPDEKCCIHTSWACSLKDCFQLVFVRTTREEFQRRFKLEEVMTSFGDPSGLKTWDFEGGGWKAWNGGVKGGIDGDKERDKKEVRLCYQHYLAVKLLLKVAKNIDLWPKNGVHTEEMEEAKDSGCLFRDFSMVDRSDDTYHRLYALTLAYRQVTEPDITGGEDDLDSIVDSFYALDTTVGITDDSSGNPRSQLEEMYEECMFLWETVQEMQEAPWRVFMTRLGVVAYDKEGIEEYFEFLRRGWDDAEWVREVNKVERNINSRMAYFEEQLGVSWNGGLNYENEETRPEGDLGDLNDLESVSSSDESDTEWDDESVAEDDFGDDDAYFLVVRRERLREQSHQDLIAQDLGHETFNTGTRGGKDSGPDRDLMELDEESGEDEGYNNNKVQADAPPTQAAELGPIRLKGRFDGDDIEAILHSTYNKGMAAVETLEKHVFQWLYAPPNGPIYRRAQRRFEESLRGI
ncbi:hypothetical protein HK102_002438 [Quaeritorhiza haematococci]|nr:hypothetical protein HK102_002438 [Quaeritorhiza haematococci]